jgi:hypothetical protein
MLKEVLLPAIGRLDEVLAREPAGGEGAWGDELGRALVGVERALWEHVADADAPGGLFELVDATRPALVRQVQDLSREHVNLLDRVGALQVRVKRAVRSLPRCGDSPAGKWTAPCPDFLTLRAEAEQVAADLKRHWDEEADLVIESVIRDVGGRFHMLVCCLPCHS